MSLSGAIVGLRSGLTMVLSYHCVVCKKNAEEARPRSESALAAVRRGLLDNSATAGGGIFGQVGATRSIIRDAAAAAEMTK
ncbi:hypothetical protein EVAR_29447_1 [Eumeta japonica]|uniref:Uncharacterized protein n=1 Tax=Eumeta variegata TaxID=151549 RepID=A0A4C1VUP7_EUMVA|nr:hypothetical protein EVAR_29447_1 [Eumeta japonica]